MEKKEQKRLTYEELKQAASGLQERVRVLTAQCQQMGAKIRELSEFAAFKRLDYLFKVVEMADKFPSDFVVSCGEEIVATMTIPEKPAEETPKTEE